MKMVGKGRWHRKAIFVLKKEGGKFSIRENNKHSLKK